MNRILNLYYLPDDDMFLLGDLDSDFVTVSNEHLAFTYCLYFKNVSVSSTAFFHESDYVIRYEVSEYLLEILEKFIISCNSLDYEVNRHGLL